MSPENSPVVFCGRPRSSTGFRPLLGLSLGLISFSLHAQSANPERASDRSAADGDKVVLEGLVVSSTLAGQARAVQLQRESNNLVNVVSSDKIGTFPDLNAAEALRRLPGISLYLNADGEGRFISIRGARPNYNGTLLNGFTVPSADRSERTVDLQTIANGLIERIEVTKAATPDLPAEGIGGVTNIILNNPINLAARTGRFSAYFGTNEYDGQEIRGEASYGDFVDKDRKFAFQISTNYRSAQRDVYEMTIRDYRFQPGSGGGQVFLPARDEYKFLKEKFRNLGADLALGAKLGDRTTVELHGFASRFKRPSTRVAIEFTGIVPYRVNGAVVDLDQDGGLVTAAATREWRTSDWYLDLRGLQFSSHTQIGDSWKLDTGLAYMVATEAYKNDTTYTSVSGSTTEPFNLTLGEHMVYLFPTTQGAANAYAAGNMRLLRGTFIPKREDSETETVPRIDISKQLELGSTSTLELKTGFYARLRDKDAELHQMRRTQLASGSLTYADLGTSQIVSDFDGKGVYPMPMSDYDTAMAFIEKNDASFGPEQILNPPGFASDSSDYVARENIYAGYLMGTLKTSRLTLVGGARYEQTNESFSRFSPDPATGLLKTDDDYDHLLPALHARYTLAPNLFLRGSWTNTVARPNPESIYGTLTVDRTARRITVPNPGLEAMKSENFDVSLEWYFGQLGQFMAGYFRKDIENFPFATQDTITFEGLPFVRTQIQGNTPGQIDGWEATFRRTLDFLPWPFNGLGFDLNYTLLDSTVMSPLRTDQPRLELQPDRIINGSFYYATNRVLVRLAVSHEGPAIDRAGTGASAQFDRYQAKRTQWDLSASFDVSSRVQLFAEWRNLTNEPIEYYYGEPKYLGVRRTFGTQIGAGVRMHF